MLWWWWLWPILCCFAICACLLLVGCRRCVHFKTEMNHIDCVETGSRGCVQLSPESSRQLLSFPMNSNGCHDGPDRYLCAHCDMLTCHLFLAAVKHQHTIMISRPTKAKQQLFCLLLLGYCMNCFRPSCFKLTESYDGYYSERTLTTQASRFFSSWGDARERPEFSRQAEEPHQKYCAHCNRQMTFHVKATLERFALLKGRQLMSIVQCAGCDGICLLQQEARWCNY